MIRLFVRSLVVVSLAFVALLGGSSGVASARPPIQPDQHFVGLVNGHHVMPVIYTVCGGPSTPGRTGPILRGQKVSVRPVLSGGGFTGLFSGVHVWIDQDVSAGGPQQLTLSTYGAKRNIPATVRVPCDGVGQVEFSSCPRLAPCAFGWVPDVVTVQFVNVAV